MERMDSACVPGLVQIETSEEYDVIERPAFIGLNSMVKWAAYPLNCLRPCSNLRPLLRGGTRGSAVVVLVLGTLFSFSIHAEQSRPGPPVHLRCEYQRAPLALGTRHPRFSWWINDSRRGALESGWQLQVETIVRDRPDSPETTPLWDSGVQRNDRGVNVPYSGSSLKSGHRYRWRVRTWDAAGKASPWSEWARFEVGLLDLEDWQARWIVPDRTRTDTSASATLEDAQWIWEATSKGKPRGRARLRRVFELSGTDSPEYAEIVCTADNHFILWMNGKQLGRGGKWEHLHKFDVAPYLRPGRNVLCARVANDDGPSGFILALSMRSPRGGVIRIVTDSSWRGAAGAVDGSDAWLRPEFPAKGWRSAVTLGEWGCAPWGRGGQGIVPFRSVLFRREFMLNGSADSARVHVCGLGAYELRINGQRVGLDRLTPGWTRFEKHIQVQTYDVTALLRPGSNVIGALVGNGWWHGRIGGENKQPDRTGPRLLVQLDVREGSRRRIVGTDASWKSAPGPILSDSIYDGERTDTRLDPTGWAASGFNAAGWQAVRIAKGPSLSVLTPQAKEPLRVIEDVPAQKISAPQKGRYVVDFGRNIVGWVRCSVTGPRGTVVRLRHAEVPEKDGTVYVANLRSARATDEWTLRGGEQVLEPCFTYHGFRYVEVTGWPGDRPPVPSAFTARAVSTDCARIGRFECADPGVTAFQQNILRGARGNMYSVPTDCPQRDERLGWTGDAQTFANTMLWNFHAVRFFGKWMRDIRDCQRSDGAIQDVNPTHAAGVASPAWGDACIIVPFQVYRHFGDIRIIRENWQCMTDWLGFLEKHARGDLYLRDGYGDWIAPVASPKKPISAAYYYYDHVLMARMAGAIGRMDDAKRWERAAARIRRAFNRKYFDLKRNQYLGGTQTSAVLPLFFGLTPEAARPAVAGGLTADIHRRNMHLSTGFLGTPYLLPVLTACGHHDVAWALARQTTYPSWGYMVKAGATTVWELWNSDRAGPGMNSRNHFALGAVGEWYFESLGGIQPLAPGFRRIQIRPLPPPGLDHVVAQHETPYGPVRCAWTRQAGGFAIEVDVPPNTTAALFLPSGAVLREGRSVLVQAGKVVAGKVPGVNSVKTLPSEIALSVGAGWHRFVVLR